MKTIATIALAAAAALAAAPALAHSGDAVLSGLLAGFAHPFTGVDHLLAMLAVGIWSAAALPSTAVRGPAAFLAAMIAGAGLAFAGVGLPFVEGAVAVSVLVLGLMILAGARLPAAQGLGLVGLFALFHGHAHAGEAAGGALTFVGGFVAATALLLLAGVALGCKLRDRVTARLANGAAVAAAGVALLASL